MSLHLASLHLSGLTVSCNLGLVGILASQEACDESTGFKRL